MAATLRRTGVGSARFRKPHHSASTFAKFGEDESVEGNRVQRALSQSTGDRINDHLRERNDLVVDVAEFAAARAVVGVAQLVNGD